MVLAGHQFARTLAFAFSPAAAYEAWTIQEEAQQVEVRFAQMTPQREVVAQPRVQVFHQRTAARRVLHDLRDGGEDGVELAAQF
jgi:hypothetical protein